MSTKILPQPKARHNRIEKLLFVMALAKGLAELEPRIAALEKSQFEAALMAAKLRAVNRER